MGTKNFLKWLNEGEQNGDNNPYQTHIRNEFAIKQKFYTDIETKYGKEIVDVVREYIADNYGDSFFNSGDFEFNKKRMLNKIDGWMNDEDDEDYKGERKYTGSTNENEDSPMNKLRAIQKSQKLLKEVGEKAGNGEIGTKLLSDLDNHLKDELDFSDLNLSQKALFLSAFIGAIEARMM
jgi:hypothetical protein